MCPEAGHEVGPEQAIEEILFLLRVLVHQSIPPSNPERYGLSGEQKQVYELCNLNLSVVDITKKMGKSGSQIRKTLTRLRKKGLVDSVNRGKSVYYFRTPLAYLETSGMFPISGRQDSSVDDDSSTEDDEPE